MKHKHIFAAVAIALAACGSLNAKTADELRIYINPGHGSWTSNDRPCQTIGREAFNNSNPDTTGFFESNTNLRKCFGLLDKLRSYGLQFDPTLNQENDDPSRVGAALDMSNNIVMSHVKAGPYPTIAMGGDSKYADSYNRDLAEIATEVEYNDFDMFISVHSNAITEGGTQNYLLFLFRGEDNRPEVENSNVMAQYCWPYAFGNEHMSWTSFSMTNMDIRGDWDFYGSHDITTNGCDGYLGVLKHHVPGFLVEGYFHTYQPGRQRAMNWDVDRMEGVEYGRGIADYFELTKESTGDIYGIVRDEHEKFRDNLYNPQTTSPDVFMPLNGVVVTLWKDGQAIDTYTTDNEWNGAFVFPEIEPGEYSLTFANEQYKEIDPVAVTVEAATTAYPMVYLENVDYEPTGANTDYPDEIDTPDIKAASEYNMEQAYVDTSIEELEGKTLRRTILKGDNLYMLALDDANDPTLIVYDTQKNAVVANVSTEGMTGDYLNVSDIQVTADGVLVACPKTYVGYDDVEYGGGTIWFYRWENDNNGLPTGDPIAWISATAGAASGNMYSSYAGETFAYSGTVDDGHIIYSTESTDVDLRTLRTPLISILDEESAGISYSRPANEEGAGLSVALLGDDYRFVVSPLNSLNIIISGSGEMPVAEFEYVISSLVVPSEIPTSILPANTPGVSFFKYAGHSFMAAPAIEDDESVGIKLIDITDGLGDAKEISTTNTSIEAAELKNLTASGVTVVIRDAFDDVTDAYINLYLTRGATDISKFTTQNVDQPKARGEWAYDLAQEENDGVYTLTFKSTGNAPQANLILESESGATVTIALGEISKGENSVTINGDEIPVGTYNWKIEVTSNAIPSVTKFFQSSLSFTKGMVIDRDPESPYFGNIYVSDAYSSSHGIYTFTPDLTQVNTTPYFASEWSSSNSSPYRLTINPNSHKVVACDWSDAHSGLFAFDPGNPETLEQVYAGTRTGEDGEITYDGQILGGSCPGADFYGTGANTMLYVFAEDYPSHDQNFLVGYDIGEKEQIDNIPSFIIESSHETLLNSEVNVVVNDKGIWCSQYRAAGNNTSAYPAFVLYDFDGNELYSSHVLSELNGSIRGAIALSDDFSKFATIDASSNILLYDVTWNGSTPTFTYSYEFAIDSSDNRCWQIQFDQAGNLFVANYCMFAGYSLPNDSPVAVTPAKAEYVITGTDTSGVELVVVEEKDAQLRIYPNPATSVVNVEAGEEITSIALYSLTGAMMKVDASISGSSATVNVDGLAVGTYLLNVNGQTAKLIKK